MQDRIYCYGEHCPKRNLCRRYLEYPGGRAVFFTRIPYQLEQQRCSYFIYEQAIQSQVEQEAYFLWQKAGSPLHHSLKFWYQAENRMQRVSRKTND